jgi:hypothetical protein
MIRGRSGTPMTYVGAGAPHLVVAVIDPLRAIRLVAGSPDRLFGENANTRLTSTLMCSFYDE